MSLEGQQLGEFEILERLGQGGMGAVYKARQRSLKRMVALKTLQAGLADDAEYIARFEQEAVAAAGLNHPNLVQVHSAGENDGLHWFAMEYVEGESAKARLKRKGRLDPLEAIAIAIHVATALEYGWRKAHLIHRDIKPDNIFLSEDGEVKLGDLGLAKSAGQTQGLTVTGHSMGTPHYISPEQVQDMKVVDFRADIYSLGCTLFHLICGKPPFDGSNATAIMLKHITEPVPLLTDAWQECPQMLNDVVGKMMQKDPDERQQDYPEVITDLRHAYEVVSNPPVVVGAAAPKPVAQQKGVAVSRHAVPAKKSKLPLYAGSGVGVLIIASVIFFAYKSNEEKLTNTEGGARNHAGDYGTAAVPVKSQSSANARAINLLALVDVQRDAVRGTWSKKPEGLALELPPSGAVLELPYEPPEEYDIEVAFTPTEGGFNPNVYLRGGSSSFVWKMNGQGINPPVYGFDLFDRKVLTINREACATNALPIENGKRYVTRVEVRRGGLRGLVNGVEMVKWSGDFHRFSLEAGFKLRHEQDLGLGSYRRAVIFHSVEVHEINGTGHITAGSAPVSTITATKDSPFINTLGMKFVPVPGTKVLFSIWDTRVQDYKAYAQVANVIDTWLQQEKDGIPVSREPEYPVVGVSWEDVQGFNRWLTSKEVGEGKLPKGAKYRLPTDEEWSWAVGLPPELGVTPAEKHQKNNVDYPWGKDYPPTKKVGNYADETFHAKFPLKKNEKENRIEDQWIEGYTDGYATTSPVGSFPANAYGLYDMGGNVWQWCEDWFDASHKDRVLRGAAWNHYDRIGMLSSSRSHIVPGYRYDGNGFRCVIELPEK